MSEPIVSVKNGKLRGKIAQDYDGRNYFSFQGIPYAKPPIGDLRFKAPLPADSWQGIKDATKDGNDCISRNFFSKTISGSEDCLFLNVYTSDLTVTKKPLKPVMFSIHSGGYKISSGSSVMYGPDFLLIKNVIVVTINYRLGIFGFLNFDDPSLDVPGNAGLKDQVLALKWVQENISQFGGDPNNVTIFGISSGASSVQYLMLSPLGKGLFHKCIMQSGCVFSTWARGQKSLPFVTEALQIKTKNEKKVLEILQKMSAEELLELQSKIPDDFQPYFNRCFAPIVENKLASGTFLTDEPEDILKSGKYNHAPIIIGFCSKEGLYADIYSDNATKSGHFIENFQTKIPFYLKIGKGSDVLKTVANKFKTFYYGNHEPCEENKNQYYLLEGDATFVWPTMMTIKLHNAGSTSPLYLYKASIETKLNVLKEMFKINCSGVLHGDDAGYIFKSVMTPKIIPGSTEDIAIRRFVTLWTNFAATGNPNSLISDSLINVHWKPVDGNELHYLEIGENLTTGINPEENRIKFWEEISSIPINTNSL